MTTKVYKREWFAREVIRKETTKMKWLRQYLIRRAVRAWVRREIAEMNRLKRMGGPK